MTASPRPRALRRAVFLAAVVAVVPAGRTAAAQTAITVTGPSSTTVAAAKTEYDAQGSTALGPITWSIGTCNAANGKSCDVLIRAGTSGVGDMQWATSSSGPWTDMLTTDAVVGQVKNTGGTKGSGTGTIYVRVKVTYATYPPGSYPRQVLISVKQN